MRWEQWILFSGCAGRAKHAATVHMTITLTHSTGITNTIPTGCLNHEAR
jgi:hypothetical protein